MEEEEEEEEEEEHDPTQCHAHAAYLQRLANWRASEVFELETTMGDIRAKVWEKDAQVQEKN